MKGAKATASDSVGAPLSSAASSRPTRRQRQDSMAEVVKLGKTYKLTDDDCPNCMTRVKEDDTALQCDSCSKWYHIKCMNMKDSEYAIWSDSDHPWYCQGCRGEVKKNVKGLGSMMEMMSSMMEKFSKFEQGLSEITTKLAEKDDKLTERVEEICEDKIRDILEVEKRKKNLILFNVPEERDQDEEELCTKLITDVDKIGVGRAKVRNVHRIGKVDSTRSRHRPLIVEMENEQMVFDVLKNARRLRDCRHESFSRIRVAKDLTIKQREIDRKLVEELKSRRNRGENDWYIRKGKLVKRDSAGSSSH